MMKKHVKRILSAALATIMVGTMLLSGGCGKKDAATNNGGGNGGAAAAKVVDPSGPITIQFWHCSGAGANGAYVEQAIKTFNETNEYGITVEGTYVGAYADALSKVSTAIAGKTAPVLTVLGDVATPVMSQKGVLADMSGYVARDKFDMDNFLEATRDYCYDGDKVITFPFNRSSAVLFYNKAIWAQAGLEPTTDITEFYKQAEQITKATGVKGVGVWSDPFYVQEALVRSLGSEGFTVNDGEEAGALDDGNLEKVLTDWLAGVEAGYIAAPAVTDAETKMRENFYAGKVASFIGSCGGLQNIIDFSEQSGVDLGVALMPAYGGSNSNCGGGNIGVIASNHTDEEIAAAWEFIKFIESDEWAAKRASDTGYLPVTYTSVETDIIKKLWAEHPQFKVAYDQVEHSKAASWSTSQSEWDTYLRQGMAYVVQDFSMTPAEAVSYLKKQAAIIFG